MQTPADTYHHGVLSAPSQNRRNNSAPAQNRRNNPKLDGEGPVHVDDGYVYNPR